MKFSTAAYLLVLSAGLLEGVVAQGFGGANGFKESKGKGNDDNSAASSAASSSATSTSSNGQGGGSDDSSLALSQDAVQTASASIGNVNVTAGEADSETSTNNFINTCAGKTLTNGLQTTSGSCNGIPMGDIPSTQNMVSTIITNPKSGDTIPANSDFTFEAQTSGLAAGTFTNAKTTYYSAPQRLDGSGKIIGHLHFTAQAMDDINPSTAPDPNTFAFFKGVDDAGNGQGLLSAKVAGGLPAGSYRVCTMSSSSNHQPVIMPIAQRGAQDDCTKFQVSDSAGGSGDNGANNDAAAASGSAASSATASASSSAASTATNNNQNQGGFGGRGRGGRGRGGKGRFARRKFVS